MVLLQETKRFRAETEEEATSIIQKAKDEQGRGEYEVKKSGYTQKTKKEKGVISEVYYWVDITYIYPQE